jgi:hypothetical protein
MWLIRTIGYDPEAEHVSMLSQRLRDAINVGSGDTTSVEGWLRIIDKAGLKLVESNTKDGEN